MATRRHRSRFARLMQLPCQYFALDGGGGAHLLAALTERHPYVKPVASPRHADLLIIVEPISQKLASVVVEIARALPHPAHAFVVGEPGAGLGHLSGGNLARLEDLMPGVRRIPQASVEAMLDAALHPEDWPGLAPIDTAAPEATIIQLPSKQEQEVATELIVLSLGPIQPFTAGPLRLFLLCDGEQVLSAQVEAGYAHRSIAAAMTQADWQQALHLARHLDPLAPIASQLAYVRAIEQLQDWQPSAQLTALREAVLALERTQNALWWLVRFASILNDRQLIDHACTVATELAEYTSHFWQQPPATWILPQQSAPTSVIGGRDKSGPYISQLRQTAERVEALRRDIERNRWLGLRTHGIGVLTTERLKEVGISGPVLSASEEGAGDVQSRLVARLHAASSDLREAAEALAAVAASPAHSAHWEVPAKEAYATVEGPRGTLGLHLTSDGGERPVHVEWQRPSAALLPLLPELLAGQKLADAEVIVASLDLAMAEGDG